MSCAMRKASRDRPSRKSPAIASRGREADRVDEAVESRPGFAELREQPLDLGVVGDVAVEHQLGVEFAANSAMRSLKRSPW